MISPDDFSAAFTTAEGWGRFTQRGGGERQTNRIEIRWGRLHLRSLALAVPKCCSGTVLVRIDGHPLRVKTKRLAESLLLSLEPITMTTGQTLEIIVD